MKTPRLIQLTELLNESPNEPFILFAIAKEYEKLPNFNEALTYYLQLQSTDPNYVGLYYHLGKLYEQLEQPAKAFKTYTTGMDIARKMGDQHALNELAGARLILGDEEDFE